MNDTDLKIFNDLKESFEESESSDKKEENLIIKNGTCKKCKKYDVVIDRESNKIVCENCGIIISDIMDYGQEWRALGFDEVSSKVNKSRVGLPINEHFKKASLSTIILGWGPESYRRYQLYNSMEYDERRLLKNFQLIDSNTEERNIPESIKDHAKNMFKTISEDLRKRGSCKHSNMAACVYFASQDKNYNQNKDKLSKCFNIKKKKFTKGCTFYKEEMFDKEPDYYNKIKPVNTYDEIKKFSKLLNIKEVFVHIIRYVTFMSTEFGIVIKNTPTSIAVGSIYLVSQVYNLNITKKMISDKCSVSDVTINKAYNSMINYQNIILPTKELLEEFIKNNEF